MKKSFLFAIFIVVLVVFPVQISFSAESWQDASKPAKSLESSVPNPYSSAMVNLITDYVVKNGEESSNAETPNVSRYMVTFDDPKDSNKVYSIVVVEKNGARSLTVAQWALGIVVHMPIMCICIIDIGPSGNFSNFLETGKLFIRDQKNTCSPEKALALQKRYDMVLNEIVDHLRSLEKR